MSLLTSKAPHTVEAILRTEQKTPEGLKSYQPQGEPIPVRGMFEPVREWSSSEEVQTLGLQVTDLVVFRCKTWPGDIHSHVRYQGVLYETVGAPQHFHVSRRTSHFRVTLKRI